MGVDITTQIIEARLLRELLNLSLRLLFQARKPDHHVGHLHASVINVVLYVNVSAGGAQQANESISQNGIAQMANMGGLIGVDAGVLDQDLLPASLLPGFLPGGKPLSKCAARDTNINVARAGNLELFNAWNLVDSGNNFFGDLAWGLAQLFGQFEGQRQSVLSQGHAGRLRNYDVFSIKLILPPQKGAYVFDKLILKFLVQSESMIAKAVLGSQFSVAVLPTERHEASAPVQAL